MPKFSLSLLVLLACGQLAAQEIKKSLRVTIINEQKNILPASTIDLLRSDSTLIKSRPANEFGSLQFEDLATGKYLVRASQTGYETGYSTLIDLEKNHSSSEIITLKSKSGMLKDVVVVSKKPPIQFLPDKTVINPEANITNAGATLMDVLEKSPGITVARDGSLIMKGKPAVNVLIDGKPTQLSGAELQAYLSGISASQVDVIELIENPGAKYDAAGNAGIINIKLKSNRLVGFNGSLNLSVAQGFYPKTGNSLNLNYRNGKFNLFMNYGMRVSREKMNLHTLRKYFNTNMEDSVLLEQPLFSKSLNIGHNLKTGFDFFLDNKTTLGLVFNGGIFDRKNQSFAAIDWMGPDYVIDSSINTWGANNTEFKRSGINLYGKHKIDAQSELTADIDYVRFTIISDQEYQTQLASPGSNMIITSGDIPSKLEIITAKVDYTKQFTGFTLETGLKTAINKTDNLAEYYNFDGNTWQPDLSRSNHFHYDKRISAAYASVDAKKNKLHWQLGLRYELTSYKANQLGNAVVKDSAFKRNYGSIFPTAFVSLELDSNNVVTFRTGRRIDRPPFQRLNPFRTVINKYTY